MIWKRALCRAFFVLAGVVAASALAAQSDLRPPLFALTMLQPGLWQLKAEGEAPRNICISDPYALIQLRHRTVACGRLVIANEKSTATIHYSCPGAGWGRTTIRAETPRVARIDTQGIADNEPFAFTAEARRVGPCGDHLSADR
jgi:hypothetical protein